MAVMNFIDALTIQAFTAVLPKLEMTLSNDIRQEIHKVGRVLAEHHTDQAALKMHDLVSHHRCLEEPFSPLYQRFQERYRWDTLQVSQATVILSSLESAIAAMAVPILQADDFAMGAKTVLRQTRPRLAELPEVMHLFVTSLQKAVSAFDEQVNRVLQALEQQLLSVEDIAHVLNVPVEQANHIVEALWQRGYIDSAKSSVVGRAMAVLTRSPRTIPPVNSATHFVLTSRGHFHLHPFLIARVEDGLE